MTELLEWLLDLQNIRLGHDAPLMLRWNSLVEAWMLFCLALLAVTWIALIYRREQTSVAGRIVLAAVRCGIVALVVAVLCQPLLVLQRNRVEPSCVVLALDTSLSMANRERYGDESLARNVARGAGVEDSAKLADYSRLELVQASLARNQAAPLKALLARHSLRLDTFARHVETHGFFSSTTAAARSIREPDSSPSTLQSPSAETLDSLITTINAAQAVDPATDLASCVSEIIAKAQGRRLAAIVLATDGRTTAHPGLPGQPTSLKDAIDLARARQIPVFPLRIGSTARPRDIEVGPLRTQQSAFVDDVLVVEAQLSARGLVEPVQVTAVLIDERTGKEAASEQAVLDPKRTSITLELRTKPTKTGLVRYRVEVSPLPSELITENNVDSVDINILDNRIAILHVDGYPRYEYRYLKNALLREPTIDLSVLLIEADEQFVQDGTVPVRRFPQTPEELSRYDVVLFGDVDPRGGWLSDAQMKMLLDFVGNEGGGFGLIAGERVAPHRFLGTLLEKLIPVRIDPTFFGSYDAPLVSGFRVRLTPEGRRSGLFRFAADRADSERLFEALPELFWFARTLGPKPGALVLAEHPTSRTSTGPLPLIVTGRYGAGNLFFQATDDTWRWRRHTGELLHDTYWVRVARELMSSSRVEQDRRFALRTDRRVYPYGVPVQAQVELFDSQLLAEQGESIGITVTAQVKNVSQDVRDGRSSRSDDQPIGGESVTHTDIVGQFDVHLVGAESNRFEGTWVPPRPGRFAIRAPDITPRPGERRASVRIRVDPPNLEARRPEADHDTLERIAAATGGRVLELDQLKTGFEAIKDRSVQIPDDIIEPLWDSKLVLMLFVAMISVEWVLRKVFGLL